MSVSNTVAFLVSGATGQFVPFTRVSGWHGYSTVTGARCQLLNAVAAPGNVTLSKGAAGGVTGSLATGVFHYAAQFVTAAGLGIMTPPGMGTKPGMPAQGTASQFGSGTLGAVITIATGDMLSVDVTVELPYQDMWPEMDAITGINIFRTKVGAPNATTIPTTAQWFLVATSPMVTGPFSAPLGGSITSITYHDTIADASVTATHPPLVDLSGSAVLDSGLMAIGSGLFDQQRSNPIKNTNKGGFWVSEVTGAIGGAVEGG